ncbi:hypothetical protein GCM10009609_41180 [Pseudonocardia aurantiaca]|uniref:ABC transporter substrate-binding protein n=1 Tax=Pseudonocardia aurantiaca TaxID=75290 RepID=A0ABW4FQ77_9PSEU
MIRHRRRTPRPLVGLAAALALAGTLAACGSGGGGGGAAPGTTLTMWTFKQSHLSALQNAARTFQDKTGVAVNVEAVTPDSTFLARVQAAANTGDLPDVLETHTNGDDFTFGGAGLLEDLSDDVPADWTANYRPAVAGEGTVTEQYYQQSLASGSKTAGVEQGQRFSVPLTIGTFGIVYANRERLAEAGITEAPKTWEDFVAALDAVKRARPQDGGLSLGLQSPSTGLEWVMQPMAYGMLGKQPFEALFSNDPAVNWASPNGTRVLQAYGQITPYWMPGTQTLDIDSADIAFAQGRSSFLVGGTFTLAFLAQNGFDLNNLVTFPIPAPSGGAVSDLSLAPFALTGLSVSATTEHKDAALQWLRHLADPGVATQFARDALDVPPTELGNDAGTVLGPVLGTMVASLGEGETAYNPGYTAYRPGAYDSGRVGEVLMNYTPLQQRDAEGAGHDLADLLGSYWSEER